MRVLAWSLHLRDLCYTVNMDKNHHIWQDWAQRLHHWGVQEWVASFLEAAGPITILGGQAVYMIHPIIGPLLPEGQMNALADLLTDTSQSQAFSRYLREDISR